VKLSNDNFATDGKDVEDKTKLSGREGGGKARQMKTLNSRSRQDEKKKKIHHRSQKGMVSVSHRKERGCKEGGPQNKTGS